jgi:hypothetical protein
VLCSILGTRGSLAHTAFKSSFNLCGHQQWRVSRGAICYGPFKNEKKFKWGLLSQMILVFSDPIESKSTNHIAGANSPQNLCLCGSAGDWGVCGMAFIKPRNQPK